MNEFQKRYKSFDNQKLLKILEEAEKYQPIAIEAAKTELAKRQISNEEILLVQNELKKKEERIDKRNKRVQNVENKAKGIGVELFETINPIPSETQTIDRKINLIVIVFGLLATNQVYKESRMIRFMFTNSLAEWDLSVITYFIPLFCLPLGVFLFWRRNKTGWILISALFTHDIVNAVGLYILTWNWNNSNYGNNDSIDDFHTEPHGIETLFPQTNPFEYILIAVIFGVTLWVISKHDIRNEFKIDMQTGLITIGISIALSSILLYLI